MYTFHIKTLRLHIAEDNFLLFYPCGTPTEPQNASNYSDRKKANRRKLISAVYCWSTRNCPRSISPDRKTYLRHAISLMGDAGETGVELDDVSSFCSTV